MNSGGCEHGGQGRRTFEEQRAALDREGGGAVAAANEVYDDDTGGGGGGIGSSVTFMAGDPEVCFSDTSSIEAVSHMSDGEDDLTLTIDTASVYSSSTQSSSSTGVACSSVRSTKKRL